jgi:hypothetical protein
MSKTRKPADIASAYRITGEIYLLGNLEGAVTVYGQQMRAHNLLWALSQECGTHARVPPSSIAVIGAGIAGLTAAAAALALFKDAAVTVFERQTDVCPLQQGCDTRWLHPRVYDWPAPGSRTPSAGLPLLSWREGRASDVARQIITGFGEICSPPDTKDRIAVMLDVRHLLVDDRAVRIEWVGRTTVRSGVFFRADSSHGGNTRFDLIIVASGFGREDVEPPFPMTRYWQNDALGQPDLSDMKNTFMVSGFGDGALVDLCRLTIERFRQDRILDELFGPTLGQVEQHLYNAPRPEHETWLDYFERIEPSLLSRAKRELTTRLRKDVRVVMALGGPEGKNSSMHDAFGAKTSFLNKLLFFLLYRCGAFVPYFGKLVDGGRRFSVPEGNVVVRHGPGTFRALAEIFPSPEVRERLSRIAQAQAQEATQQWPTGHFPCFRSF